MLSIALAVILWSQWAAVVAAARGELGYACTASSTCTQGICEPRYKVCVTAASSSTSSGACDKLSDCSEEATSICFDGGCVPAASVCQGTGKGKVGCACTDFNYECKDTGVYCVDKSYCLRCLPGTLGCSCGLGACVAPYECVDGACVEGVYEKYPTIEGCEASSVKYCVDRCDGHGGMHFCDCSDKDSPKVQCNDGSGDSSLSAGAIAAIVLIVLAMLAVIGGLVAVYVYKWRSRRVVEGTVVERRGSRTHSRQHSRSTIHRTNSRHQYQQQAQQPYQAPVQQYQQQQQQQYQPPSSSSSSPPPSNVSQYSVGALYASPTMSSNANYDTATQYQVPSGGGASATIQYSNLGNSVNRYGGVN